MIKPRNTPDRRACASKVLVKRATDAAYSEALALWPESEHNTHTRPYHIWAAGFVQGYLARRPKANP